MRRIGVVLVMAMIGQAGFAVQPVAVAELEQELAASRQSPDDELAGRLSPIELTERLPSADLARLIATLPGDKSREALRVLADMSEFLDPPAAQIPARPAPDESAQREMMGRVVEYVSRTTHKLPNFFATRRTTRFEDWPQGLKDAAEVAGRYIPPQVVGGEKALV